MKNDIYSFGMCKICKKYRALKNDTCPECEEKQPKIPEFFKDIFEGG